MREKLPLGAILARDLLNSGNKSHMCGEHPLSVPCGSWLVERRENLCVCVWKHCITGALLCSLKSGHHQKPASRENGALQCCLFKEADAIIICLRLERHSIGGGVWSCVEARWLRSFLPMYESFRPALYTASPSSSLWQPS